MTQVTLSDLLHYLAEERNLDLRGYKTSSLERRFRHRLFQLKIGDYSEYLAYLRESPAEVNELLNTVLINVTHFFRDPQAWEVLRNSVLPGLLENIRPGDTFRAWSAGCASGEEAYSLAILLAEHFGSKIKDYDIKVYATDIDEDALAAARQGEYSADKLRHVAPEWRERYFQGDRISRVSREIRRLCIFGRSNLASDAPISHVRLLLCRNVLIYFDSQLQNHILRRLHYALEPNGVLVLGKAETQLSQSGLFESVHSKWRVFRRLEVEPGRRVLPRAAGWSQEDFLAKNRQDYSLLKSYHDAIVQTVEPGVIVLDPGGLIVTQNDSAQRLLGLQNGPSIGKTLEESGIFARCPDLRAHVERLRSSGDHLLRSECSISDGGHEARILRVTVRAVITERGDRAGALIYIEDVTAQQKLQHTVEELETTGEELQSSNEELETTNEELQSTNEELETTNEELQSTNEELETTNEELQALNEELGTTNEELEVRTRELDEMNARYAETIEKMPWPVMVVDAKQIVQFWNGAMQKLFGLPAKAVIGLELRQLPVTENLRSVLTRRFRDASLRARDLTVRNQFIETSAYTGAVDLRFTTLNKTDDERGGILILFAPLDAVTGSSRNKAKAKPNASKKAARKKAARKKRR